MINLIIDRDGVAREYDGTYDITIHCESEEEQRKARELLLSLQQTCNKLATGYIKKQIAVDAMLGQPPEAHYPSWFADQIMALPEESFEIVTENKRYSKDTISKKEAIKAVTQCRHKAMSGYDWIRMQEAVVKLSDLPTTESCWIPVAERLPETEDKVMCCTITKKGTRNIVIGYYMQDSGLWACGMNSNVIAWMPLPDPYRKGAE